MSKTYHTKKKLLGDALIEINKEMKRIAQEKNLLDKELKSIATGLNRSRLTEIALRNKISYLLAMEAKLNMKKDKVESELVHVNEKLSKISSIKRELIGI